MAQILGRSGPGCRSGHLSPVVQARCAGALFRADLLSYIKLTLDIYMSLYIHRVGGHSCLFSSANPKENLQKCQIDMADFRYLKLTFDTLRGILSRMTDSTASDRSRFYSVAELAQEFSLTSQGIRFYEESGLISPARVGRTRVFNYQDRARLILIQRLRRLGFSLDAIREYLSLYKADVTGAAQYRRGLERITERIRELEDKRRDLDETLEGLRTLEAEANERLDRALREDAKRQPRKSTNGGKAD